MSDRIVSEAEFHAHEKASDWWVIINGIVYDLSNFNHPGGNSRIRIWAGKDGSSAFNNRHGDGRLERIAGTRGLIRVGPIKWNPSPPPEKPQSKKKTTIAKPASKKTTPAPTSTPQKSSKRSRAVDKQPTKVTKKIRKTRATRTRASVTKRRPDKQQEQEEEENDDGYNDEEVPVPVKKPARKRRSNTRKRNAADWADAVAPIARKQRVKRLRRGSGGWRRKKDSI